MPEKPVPARPAFPPAEQARVQYQIDRYRLICDDYDDLAEEYLETVAGAETAEHWGLPDTALNPISSATRQLTVPGLYGVPPAVTDGGAGGELLDELRRAGVWARGQWLSYLVVGIGIAFRRVLPVRRGDHWRLVDKIVRPFDVWVEVDPDDPLEPVAVYHLQLRRDRAGDPIYTWDVWRITRDPVTGRASGSWRVVTADEHRRDVSAEYLRAGDYRGPIEGKRFPCFDDSGDAVLPWVVYRAQDTGEFWPDHWRRAMHRGSLQAMAAWTYTGWSALFATGEAHLLLGLNPDALPADQRRGEDNADGTAVPTRSMRLHPSTVVAVPTEPGRSVTDVRVGPGNNLPSVMDYASGYNTLVHVSDGLHPSDATRQHANPTSGAALEISATSRREFSRQVEPFFASADLRLIEVATYLLRPLVAVWLPDPAAYAIRYHTIPLTSSELAELRDQLDWETDRGHTSRVDAHLRLHPSKTRAQARADLVAAAIDDLLLEQEIEAARAEAGLPPKQRPPAPPEQGLGDEEDDEVAPGDEVDDEDAPDGADDENNTEDEEG